MSTFTLYLISLSIILLYTTAVFLLALKKKDNSIIDIAYGAGFIVTAWMLAILKLMTAPLTPYSFLILILITIWGTRLSYRIYQKNNGKPEDFRYKNWRDLWMKKGLPYFLVRAYLQIFVLQGIVISVVLLPFTLSIITSPMTSYWIVLGLIVWCIGFFFEAIGDRQLDRFIKDNNRVGTILKTGLWKYTRHPNYFGESTMWVGIALISLTASSSTIVILSPILITHLLLFVSGIPMLEKKWDGNPEWEEYKKKTSAFFPMPTQEK